MSEFQVDINKLILNTQNKIQKLGYVYPSPEFVTSIPEEDKMFDTDVSDKTQDFLLKKLTVFTSLLASALVDESRYATEVAAIERELEIVKANIFTKSVAAKIEDKRKERDSDEQVVRLQEKLTVADTILKRFTALRIGYEKFCFLYSRALTVQSEEKKFQ